MLTTLSQADIDELLAFKQSIKSYTFVDVNDAIKLYDRKENSTAVDLQKRHYLEKHEAYLQSEKKRNTTLVIVAVMAFLIVIALLLHLPQILLPHFPWHESFDVPH